MGALIRHIYKKVIEKNENFISVIIGGTGSGKSYSFISLAQQFQLLRKSSRIFIIFRHEELLNLLLPGNDTIKKGDVVIYEEMGISADHRKFWSITNDTIRYVSQIARNRNFLFLMNLPFLNLLDKDVLPLVHVLFQTAKKIFEKRIVRCRVTFNDVNYITGKSYFKYPLLYNKEAKKWCKVKYIDFIHPEKILLKSNMKDLENYEEVKDSFNNSIYTKLLEKSKKETDKMNTKGNANTTDIKKYAKIILSNKDKYIKKYGTYSIIDKTKIAVEFGLGRPSSKNIKDYVEGELGIGYGVKKKAHT